MLNLLNGSLARIGAAVASGIDTKAQLRPVDLTNGAFLPAQLDDARQPGSDILLFPGCDHSGARHDGFQTHSEQEADQAQDDGPQTEGEDAQINRSR